MDIEDLVSLGTQHRLFLLLQPFPCERECKILNWPCSKGTFRLPIKSARMEKFPWWLGHAMLSGRFRRERFTARARRGGKGDKSVIPQARSRRWAAFIAIFICHGEEAKGTFLYSVYRCAKTQVWMAFTVYRLSRFDAVIVVWMRPNWTYVFFPLGTHLNILITACTCNSKCTNFALKKT